MRRFLAFGAVWVMSAALAAGVAWAGIAVVGDQVTDDRPAPLSADEVAQAVEAEQRASTTTAPPGGTTTTTSATPPADAAATTRTYRMVGGVVTLSFSPSGVEVVGATPNEGFSVDSEPEHGNGVRVEFKSDAHKSRVDAWWDGGPQVERREDGETVGADDNRGPGSGDDGGSSGGPGPG
ncbi:MAG TPA: hypothetical protein VFG94_01330 [Acidimicrobiales bacterium]|nr:hypothetical protein [Acidimicrobiales bacterium]